LLIVKKLYNRVLDLDKILKKNSFFLFGARGIGKSWLIKNTLRADYYYDLLDAPLYSQLSARPELFAEQIALAKPGALVVVDEIQRIPELLNTVHKAIENQGLTFLLTGSSARKLRRGKVNMLAGRVWEARLFPLTYFELGKDFNLETYLTRGGLPRSYRSEDWAEELRAYVGTYLKEEISDEALTRSLPQFSRFFDVAAMQSGQELSLEGIASDAQVKAKTVSNYVEILEDTLLGFRVQAFQKTKTRKAITRAKFFLFDVGVTGYLTKRGDVRKGSENFAKAFEHFVFQEVQAYLSYFRSDMELMYWRSVNKQEVDMIIGEELAVEIKATSLVQDKHLKGLRALREEKKIKNYCVISDEQRARIVDGIIVYPWRDFLDKLWANELFNH